MLFNKLELSELEIIRQFYCGSKSRINDNTPGGTVMWRDYFSTRYAILNETLILKVKYMNNLTAFPMPIGKDAAGALKAIEEHCRSQGLKMVLCTLTKEDLKKLENNYDFEARKEPMWFDYLYKASDLADLPGKKYNGQRNHINFFKRTYHDYALKEIGRENAKDSIELLNKLKARIDSFTPMYEEELVKTLEVLENFDLYGQIGLALYIEGAVAAFSIGEILADTLFVHIEKSDALLRGAPQMIATEFVKMNVGKGIKFVNREEDLGDEGLRRSKLSYHPVEIVEKFTAFIKL
ncbi:MAG: phosphatidylglycerol lysyltransferase domain-containing protein [Clostridiales bacterium]|nr:phosphatidylglycerol lysyltransferase domain-containing protein [Clostridiales bacterium]